MSAGYALIVSRVAVEDRTTELHVLVVHRDLALEDAMRLLGERPAGTVGHLRRLPTELPEVGAVLRLEAERARFGQVTPADNSVAARRERRQRAMGSKP
jgi:hypothetical protein